jgi:hypothetical protein
MHLEVFKVLLGLRLFVVRRAADMLVVHFGDIRPDPSGEGTVGDYALHVQCPWRFDGPVVTITGRDDVWNMPGLVGARTIGPMKNGLRLQDEWLSLFFTRGTPARAPGSTGVTAFALFLCSRANAGTRGSTLLSWRFPRVAEVRRGGCLPRAVRIMSSFRAPL